MDPAELNPYAPPSAEGPRVPAPRAEGRGEVLAEYSLEQLGKPASWLLLVYADRLEFIDYGQDKITVPRGSLGETLEVNTTATDAVLRLRSPRLMLKLPMASADLLRRDLGPDLEQWARGLSKRVTRFDLVSGVSMLLGWYFTHSLFLAVLGASLLLAGLGRIFHPGRWLFLLVAVRAAVFVGVLLIDILVFDRGWVLAILAWTFGLGTSLSYRRYKFFRPTA